MKIVFATSNANKIKELKELLPDDVEILGLNSINCSEEIPENQPTIEGNAIQKAQYIFDNYGVNCFAEDTGLEVLALGGEPGVYSARYAGPDRDANRNMDLVLEKLHNKQNRSARFKTVIALIIDRKLTTFEGIVNGTIIHEKRGIGGFGYDPIFKPDGYDKTFGELPMSEKNKISHRARATNKLLNYFSKLYP